MVKLLLTLVDGSVVVDVSVGHIVVVVDLLIVLRNLIPKNGIWGMRQIWTGSRGQLL